MTDEYLDRKWAEIEDRLKRFEATASPHDKMMLDYWFETGSPRSN